MKILAGEPIDVTGNGNVVKVVYEEASDSSSKLPEAGDRIKAHYTGSLAKTSEVFDSSRKRGTPHEFTIGQGQVIGCWDKGIATMRAGEAALLTCQPDEAYGDYGSPPKIPGGATLMFDVEVIEIASPVGSKEEL